MSGYQIDSHRAILGASDNGKNALRNITYELGTSCISCFITTVALLYILVKTCKNLKNAGYFCFMMILFMMSQFAWVL